MSQASASPPEPYPVVRFIVAHGKRLSLTFAALVLILGLWGAFQFGLLWLAPVALAGSGVLLALLLSYVEVLTIIADTLIPKY